MSTIDEDFMDECVIESCRNDYENIDSISSEIEQWAKREGRQYSLDALARAIGRLAASGALSVFEYSALNARFVPAEFDPNRLQDMFLFTLEPRS